MNKKSILRYGISFFIMLLLLFFLFLSDESHKPIQIKGDAFSRQNGTQAYGMLYVSDADTPAGTLGLSPRFTLRAGDYTLGLEVSASDFHNTVDFYANDTMILSKEIAPLVSYQEIHFTLDKDIELFRIAVNYGGSGSFSLTSMDLSAAKGFYTDSYFFAGCVVALFLAFLIFDLRRKKTTSQTSSALFLALIGITFVASLPILNNNLQYGDDIGYHLIRIEGIKDGIRSGQFPVLIYPEGPHGFGYLNAMYPSMFLYLPALLRLGGVSVATSYKTLLILANFACVMLTYCGLRSVKVRSLIALMATAVYALLPYHFTNLYARGALGEALAMTFLPIALIGLYHVLLGEKKNYWMLVVGITGLLQSHVLSSLLLIIVCVLGGIVFLSTLLKEKRILTVLKSAGLVLALNLWFLIPFLYFYKNGNLCTQALQWSHYSEYSLYFHTLFGVSPLGDYRSLSLGLPVGILILLTMIYIVHRKVSRLRLFSIFLTALGFLFLFMTLCQFPGKEMMDLFFMKHFLETMQFPWRLLGIISAIFVVTGSIALENCISLRSTQKGICIALASIAVLISVPAATEGYPYANNTIAYTDGHLQKIYGIPRGDNSIAYPYEWRTATITEAIIRDAQVTASSPNIYYSDYSKKGTTSKVMVNCEEPNQYVVLPLTFYHGYQVTDDSGKKLKLFQSLTGQVAFEPNSDGLSHTYTIRYKKSALFHLAEILSFLTLIGLFVYPRAVKYLRRRTSK